MAASHAVFRVSFFLAASAALAGCAETQSAFVSARPNVSARVDPVATGAIVKPAGLKPTSIAGTEKATVRRRVRPPSGDLAPAVPLLAGTALRGSI